MHLNDTNKSTLRDQTYDSVFAEAFKHSFTQTFVVIRRSEMSINSRKYDV